MTNTNNDYLRIVYRGGLRYPSEIVINILVIGLKLFKTIISERFEQSFIKSKHQRQLFANLMADAIDSLLADNIPDCSSCGTPFCEIIYKMYYNF